MAKDKEIDDAVRHFDQLPDSALVSRRTVEMLTGRSRPSVYRDIAAGKLPQPVRWQGSIRFRVGDLRKAMGVEQRQAA